MKRSIKIRNRGVHALRTKQGIAAAKAGAILSLNNDWIHAHAVDPDFDNDEIFEAMRAVEAARQALRSLPR